MAPRAATALSTIAAVGTRAASGFASHGDQSG